MQLTRSTPKGSMVRLTLHQLMRQRGITAYALSRGTGLSYPSAYRLSRPAGVFGRLHADTLERLCDFLDVQPGDLLRWTPGRRGKPRRNGRPVSP
jgi:DNA-binding Xre family transcriptional regulator